MLSLVFEEEPDAVPAHVDLPRAVGGDRPRQQRPFAFLHHAPSEALRVVPRKHVDGFLEDDPAANAAEISKLNKQLKEISKKMK